MKKILSILAIAFGLAISAHAQQPTSNLYMQTTATPPYAKGGNTGMSLNWGYKELAPTSGHDTIKVVTINNNTHIVIDSVVGNASSPLVIMADSTGDTASQSNYPNGKATKWYKKNPFQYNYQCDELTFTFNGSKASYSTVKFGSLFMVTNTWPHDTVMIPKVSTNTGGLIVHFQYSYQRGAWVLAGYGTW